MRIELRALAALLIFATLTACLSLAQPDDRPNLGSALSGRYRNLFAEAGYSTEAITQKVELAYSQLFHGEPEDHAIYYPAGENARGKLAYILDVNSNDVRSEGMSYGMMMAVQMDKKEDFDAIWNWAMSYMYQSDPTHPAYGYFAWSVARDGKALDEMPAPDGEEYFVTALYFASERWGNGNSIYHYQAQADRLLSHILHREQITGTASGGEKTVINLFDKTEKMVRFTPSLKHAYHTDASYHLPAFYEVWARVGPQQDRQFWREAARTSRDYFQKTAHSATGLTPDYGNYDGSPWAAPWRPESVDFRYDAWRTAMNWSFDWAWWAADERQIALSNRLLEFFAAQGIDNYVGLYTLDGKPLNKGHSAALVAMNATAALAATTPSAAQFVHALWRQPVPTGNYRYYDGMLYMMGLLHVSGRYKAWLPPTPAQSK